MKQICLLILFGFCMTVFAQDITFDKNLTGWKKIGRKVASDGTIKTSPNYSLHLGSDSSVTRELKLDPECEYEISFNVRGEGIQSAMTKSGKKTAAYMIFRGNRRGKLIGEFESGTFDWKKRKGSFTCRDLGGVTDVTMALVMRGEGEVWFDDIKIEKKVSRPFFREAFTNDLKEVAVVPGGTYGFFDPGAPVKFVFMLNPWPDALQFKCKVKDESGKVILDQPMKALSKEFVIPGQVPGYYIAEFELYRKGSKIYRVQSAFVVNRPIAKRDPFFAGGYGAMSEMIDGLKRIGIGSIHLKFLAADRFRTAKAKFDFNMKRNHRKFIDSGDFHLSAVFQGMIKQKGGRPTIDKFKAGFPVAGEAYWDEFANLVEMYVTAHRGKISDYVIQCEIPSQAGHKDRNCGTLTEAMFNQMISTRIASRIIRRIDPKATVWFGGNNRLEHQNTTERIVAEDLVNEIDGLVIDAYTGDWILSPGHGNRVPETRLLEFYRLACNLSERLGLAKKRWIRNEEVGYAIRYGEAFDGEYAVLLAALTARTIILSKASTIQQLEIHTPIWYINQPRSDESTYMGTVWRPYWFNGKGRDTECAPMPGGAMYVTAASELAFVQKHEMIVANNLYACIFTRPDGKSLAAIWDVEKKRDFRISLPTETRLVNMYGREFRLPKGRAVLPVGPEPCYLTLSGNAAETAALIRAALKENTPGDKLGAE